MLAPSGIMTVTVSVTSATWWPGRAPGGEITTAGGLLHIATAGLASAAAL